MAQVARLEARLTGNDVEFNNALDRAEKRAATFTGRVESGFQGLFRRTPGRRAERAISGLLGDISTGSVSQGIAQFAGRLTGLGLAAGVGVGVAVELFSKLHDSVVEVSKAHDALGQAMSKPIALTSIEGLGKAIDSLQEKQSTFTHQVGNYLSETGKGVFSAILTGGKTSSIANLGQTGIDEERERQGAIDKRQAAERLRGRNELIRADVLAGIQDPQRKALAEMRFKFEDRRKELMSNPDKGSAQRLKALDVEQDNAEKNFKLTKEAANIKLETEEKIQRLIHDGLKGEDLKKVRTGLELKNIDNQISAETDPGKLRALKLERSTKENELRSFGMPQTPGGPEFGSIAARDAETNDPNRWGSLAWSAAQRGEGPAQNPQANTSQELLKATNETNNLMRQAWLTP